MDGTYTNLDFMYGVTHDTRNQVFKPTEGYIAKFTQVLPIVMDSPIKAIVSPLICVKLIPSRTFFLLNDLQMFLTESIHFFFKLAIISDTSAFISDLRSKKSSLFKSRSMWL